MRVINTKSTQAFEVRFWSKEYYGNSKKQADYNIYNGFIVDLKNKKAFHFHSAGEFLKLIEKLYKSGEKNDKI